MSSFIRGAASVSFGGQDIGTTEGPVQVTRQPDHPERCETCRYFWRSEVAQRFAEQNSANGVHGTCRRYAPGKEGDEVLRPLVIRHPEQVYETDEGPVAAADLARELGESIKAGSIITLPSARDSYGSFQWDVQLATGRSISPSYWCGEWSPQEASSHAKVYADWLEERVSPNTTGQDLIDLLHNLKR